jgi:hypothetical protein
MNRKLITFVLCVLGSVGGCASLGTQADEAFELMENLAKPTVEAFVNGASAFPHGQLSF